MNIHYSIHSRVSLNTKFTSKCEASEVHILLCSVRLCGKVLLCKHLCVSNEMQNEILKCLSSASLSNLLAQPESLSLKLNTMSCCCAQCKGRVSHVQNDLEQ